MCGVKVIVFWHSESIPGVILTFWPYPDPPSSTTPFQRHQLEWCCIRKSVFSPPEWINGIILEVVRVKERSCFLRFLKDLVGLYYFKITQINKTDAQICYQLSRMECIKSHIMPEVGSYQNNSIPLYLLLHTYIYNLGSATFSIILCLWSAASCAFAHIQAIKFQLAILAWTWFAFFWGRFCGAFTSVCHHFDKFIWSKRGGFTTYCDGHHDGWVVGWGGQFPLSANALSGWVFLNNLH